MRLRRHWNELGRRDPLWAALTDPDKQGNRWSVDEFLATGRKEIAAVMADLERLGISVRRERALDFGCGAGRLTRALADYFDEVVGIDIARSMIDLARSMHADCTRCRFVVNEANSLTGSATGSIDFVYSRLVLQHIHPRYVRQYLAEFVRVLAPGGVLVFQLPSDEIPPVEGPGLKTMLPLRIVALVRAIRRAGTFPRMEVRGLPRADVERLLTTLDTTLVEVMEDRSHGANTPGYRYCAVKNPGASGVEPGISRRRSSGSSSAGRSTTD